MDPSSVRQATSNPTFSLGNCRFCLAVTNIRDDDGTCAKCLMRAEPVTPPRKRRVREGHPCPHGCEGGKGFRPLILHFAKQHLKLSGADLEASKEQERCEECRLHMRRILVPIHRYLFHHIELPPNWASRYEAITADPFHVSLSDYPVGELEGAPLVVKADDWAEYVSEPEEDGVPMYSEDEEEFLGAGDSVDEEMHTRARLHRLQPQMDWVKKQQQQIQATASSPSDSIEEVESSLVQEEEEEPRDHLRFKQMWETLDWLGQIPLEERVSLEGVKFRAPYFYIQVPDEQKPSTLERLSDWATAWNQWYGATSHLHFLIGSHREVIAVVSLDHPDFEPQFKLEQQKQEE